MTFHKTYFSLSTSANTEISKVDLTILYTWMNVYSLTASPPFPLGILCILFYFLNMTVLLPRHSDNHFMTFWVKPQMKYFRISLVQTQAQSWSSLSTVILFYPCSRWKAAPPACLGRTHRVKQFIKTMTCLNNTVLFLTNKIFSYSHQTQVSILG